MAFRVPLLGRSNSPTPIPPMAASSPASPTDTLGHTPPEQDPGGVRPRVGARPYGASGRANFYGLPQWDELNRKLTGVQGLRLLDDMYWSDAHVRRLVLAAWAPLVAGTWSLEPYGGEDATDLDREVAETIWWMLTEWMSPSFTEHLYELGPSLLRFGFTPFEQLWASCEYKGKTLLGVRKLDWRMPKSVWKWWQDDWGELTHIGQILPNRPDVVIPAADLVYYRLASEGDNWMGRSLLRHCYKHWSIKDRLERIDMVGQERKAVGVPIVYHSPDIPDSVLTQVEQALASMHTSEVAYLMVGGWKMGEAPADADPANQWLVDIVQFDSSSGNGIHDSIEYHQTAISASFLTDFLELGHHQVGARATAEVQEDPFLTAINGALLPPVIPPLNRLIDRIRKVNWDKAEGSPTLKLALHDEASLSEIAAYLVPLVQAEAVQVDPDLEDWLRARAAMPAANPDVRARRQAVQDAQDEASLAGAKAAANPQPAVAGPGQPAMPGQPVGGSAAGGTTKPPNDSSAPAGKRNRGPVDKSTQLDQSDADLAAAGLIVQAADTGRVLLIQRTPDKHDDDSAYARWEFPGGKPDDDDVGAWDTAVREWQEETGATLGTYQKIGAVLSPDGRYRAFVVRIPRATDVNLNPDDDEASAVRWWKLPDLNDDRVRDKVQEMLPELRRLLALPNMQLDQPAPDAGGQIHADIAVDFDGVIHPNTPDDQPLTEPPIPGAVTGMRQLAARYPVRDGRGGVVVFTARVQLAPVRAWLAMHGFPDVLVTNVKPIAKWYLDDHAFPNRFPGWPVVQRRLLDGFAPMSGGVAGPGGLQMVPDVPGSGRAAKRPPNLRKTSSSFNCHSCAWRPGADGRCQKYHWPVDRDQVCDTWKQRARQLDAAAVEPTAKWWERLLSQDRLREAMDGCRDHIEASCGPAARLAAQRIAEQARNGQPLGQLDAPQDLVDTLTHHYQQLYQLGRDTVNVELARQRRALGPKALDDPTIVAAAAATGSRLERARHRGEHSARQIVNAVTQRLGRAQISGLLQPGELQTAAENAAAGQLRVEALANTAASINDGRADSAVTASDIAGAYYTSVMDERSCDECVKADDGKLLSPDEAVALGPPNPLCAGQDRCRCALVWVLSSDPAALATVIGE